ncbi:MULTISPECIES: asparagine synthase (glutamine-hydrolyzing) [unclassified Inquilinus]|uniref:asparagine synthase (glutamine-hydrolyzing) n=1 Tax=unclassified Inquilinus TaxID=2645927 RepID=UPI003F92F6F8
MCGIAGLVTCRSGPPDAAMLSRLERALDHRGPDSSGRFVGDGVALISTRLAIVDVAHGQQPFHGPADTVLVANGEIYNAPALRATVGVEHLATGSDCEPLVHLYAGRGPSFAEDLRGMYAIAVYDRPRRRLVLSRDPFGIKPLYYVESGGTFAFASEPQALFKAGLARPEVATPQRAELMQLKFTTGEDTIFPQVRRVLPGETLVVEDGRIVQRLHRAALPAAMAGWTGDPDCTLAALDRVLEDSVGVHLNSDVPCGLFLSGGVDSSLLLAYVRRMAGRRVQAITIGYDGADPADESREAIRVAALAGADCERVEMDAAAFWALAPAVAAALDDPTGDPAALPTYCMAQAAAKGGLKVMLCGEGADELFGGYVRYRRTRLPWRWVTRGARAEGIFHGLDGVSGLEGWRTALGAVERRETEAGRTLLQTLQAIDCDEALPNALLAKLDRCLMRHGVEGRTPFIDPVVADFAFSLPDSTKIGLKRGKLLLRRQLAAMLPDRVARARKKGFNTPVGRWMAGRRADLRALLPRQPGLAAFVSPDLVRHVCDTASERPQQAWSLLFYALWHSHHVMGLPPDGSVSDVLAQAARN